MARGDPAGRFPAEEEEDLCWVPVRIAKLTNLSRDLGVALESRWWDHHEERRWVKKAAQAAAATEPDAERQLSLARELVDVMSISWYGFSCALREMAEDLDEALDPARRPRPASAAWWSFWYLDDGGCDRHGFVHLSRGQVARARGLLADARARARRIGAPVEDLERRCWPAPPAPAAHHMITALVGRLRHVQRLADAVLGPLQALKRLVDHLLLADGTDARRARGGRGRGRSAPPPPPQRASAQHLQEDPCMLRRSATTIIADG